MNCVSHNQSYSTFLENGFPDDFQDLVVSGVTIVDHEELGHGAYGRVYAVNYYNGTICTAKEIHSNPIKEVGEMEM